jgi:hypothetical protein
MPAVDERGMTALGTGTCDPAMRALVADDLLQELPDEALVELLVDQFRFYAGLGLAHADAVASSVAALRLAFAPRTLVIQ